VKPRIFIGSSVEGKPIADAIQVMHHDRTLEHVDEGVRIVSVDFISAARRVGDRKDETFFAGNVRQGFGHDFFHVGRWSGRRELRG
jgi:hypothetical protein